MPRKNIGPKPYIMPMPVMILLKNFTRLLSIG